MIRNKTAKKDEYAVQLKGVSFEHEGRAIFKNLDLNIPSKKVVAILGPSGTGKTTLLRLIGKLIKPSAGKIKVLGEDVNSLSGKNMFLLRQRLGLLFQSGALFTDLSVFDNIAFPIRQNKDVPEDIIKDIVLMKLESVGLRGARDLMPSQLSGGMTRRVALARSVALDPELMMYDEPFTGQDPITLSVLLRLIKALNDALNMTSIVVTHDVSEVFSIADHVIIISEGKIIAEGTPSDIRNSHEKMIEQFVHGHPDGPVPFHYPAKDVISDFMEDLN
jgi:phospholipid/cholesterol/gamma-HCH transport system ATP-binding protein